MDSLWSKLGIKDETDNTKLLAEELHGTLTEAQALRRAPKDRTGKVALAAVAAILLATAVLAASVPVGAVSADAASDWARIHRGLVNATE